MKVSLIATAVIATGMIIATTVGFVQMRASDLMLPDAMQTKAEIIKRIPLGSPIVMANKLMTDNGFRCGTMKNTRYADFANPSNKQVTRGPADTLYCDSGEKSGGLMFVTKRWQVSFENSEGKVSYVAVGVGLTGP